MENSTGKTCEYEANVEALRQVPVFAKLPIGVIKAIAFGCDRKIFRDGAELFSQGEADDRAYHIVSGEADLARTENGEETVVRAYGPGTFLGGLALLGDIKRPFTLRARGEVAAIVVPRAKVQAELAKTAEALPKFLSAVAGAVVQWEEGQMVRAGGCARCEGRVGVSVL
jgi:CRP-like cAMP-binding protein